MVITGRDQARLDGAQAAHPALHTIQSDVSDPASIARLCETIGRQFPAIDTLINNAGIMRNLKLTEPDALDDLTREIDTNLAGRSAWSSSSCPC